LRTFEKLVTDSFVWIQPSDPEALVVDSPNSGSNYPHDFVHACTLDELRAEEAQYVDQLWSVAPSLGATLLLANAPRTYIDYGTVLPGWLDEANGGDGEESVTNKDGEHASSLVRNTLRSGVPIRTKELAPNEIRHRITRYYAPYHERLAQTIAEIRARHDIVWHLTVTAVEPTAERWSDSTGQTDMADFMLGNLGGRTCSSAFAEQAAALLRNCGYTVAFNERIESGGLIAHYGRPQNSTHSLEIGIRSDLYMDPKTRELHRGYEMIRADLALFTKNLISLLPELALRAG